VDEENLDSKRFGYFSNKSSGSKSKFKVDLYMIRGGRGLLKG
jgi:hypothetical protein